MLLHRVLVLMYGAAIKYMHASTSAELILSELKSGGLLSFWTI